MARNIEIKARLRDAEATRRLVAAASDGPPVALSQTDTFFRVPAGRLKLRDLSATEAELIVYQRPDTRDPVESEYRKVAVSDAPALRAVLASALGVAGQVVKRRLLYRVGRTRVHLDDVEDLGCFLELEVEMEEGEPAADGIAEAHKLMHLFGIEEEALVSEAYVDLLNRRGAPAGATLDPPARGAQR